ncbi:Ammonia channel precursor [Caulifigura coniformis]|uniref:Ammonium transporter n=1 Tax=Caulifigura coniformis TaxID=2527983 RepID=A0A517SLK5_9PLAN|nr:ammonium transporter [Caulifigura coniformis]QDT57000.1 Ammonia channel precursor [Caulifigura coniformis]
MKRWVLMGLCLAAIGSVAIGHTSTAWAQDAAAAAAPAAETPAPTFDIPDNETLAYSVDNLLLFLCAVLVIFMQAGFALVESGLNSAKNTVNILFKNTIDFCVGVLLYFFIGYALMYPGGDYAGKYFGYAQPNFAAEVTAEDIHGGFASGALRKLHPQADFLFQAAFCATTATIVSGAVAGRMKFIGYLIYTCIITALVYPISGMWKWGGGWLAEAGFHDFAGSILVHAVGGFAGLAGAMVLGPRLGRYNAEGKSVPWPGHNLAYACLGVFILMIGWYGFNPGSVLAFSGAANTGLVMTVAVNTTLGACAGGLSGMLLSWVMFKKPDLTLALNGILAGLVGVTANADVITNQEALIIGAVAGVLCLLAVVALDKFKIDDPVGAFPVHGVCGVWGGIATGIFGEGKDLMVQIKGTLACTVWAFVTMMIVFLFLKAIGLLRVPPEEEIEGLDMVEHGQMAYGLDPK